MNNLQGSRVFLLEDLSNILQAIMLTNDVALRMTEGNPEYRQGFLAAIGCVATALNCRLDTRGMRP